MKKRNDPCPRFSSADKGHFHSILVSNIICLSSCSSVYLLRIPDEFLKSCLLAFFSNWVALVSIASCGALVKGEWRETLTRPTTHWLSLLGSALGWRVILLAVQIPLCSAGHIGSTSVVYFAIGLYLLCCDYSIAHFSVNCNIQNERSWQNIFVHKIEKSQIAENVLQFV